MDFNLTDIPSEIQDVKMRFGIVGNAPAFIAAISRAIQVAPIDLSVLITGESGTGKEFFPKIIHQYSHRKHAKYIAVNCGAIPEGTIDSELFGHEKGAFTGAVATRKGYFEEADGGTIFLDEVGELPLTTQARLLRVLESGEFIKVGSSTVQKSNVRIVAATNVDMTRAVAEGRFREDLYYRLSTVSINIPPLRERGRDILLLARKFAADFSEKYTMPQMTLDDNAREELMRYRWPGNVRQLKNIVEQIALFDAGRTVSAGELDNYLPRNGTNYTPAVNTGGGGSHSYEHERELLFNMIFKMQREIDSLRDTLDNTQGTTAKDLFRTTPAVEIEPSETEAIPAQRSLVRYTPASPIRFTEPTYQSGEAPHSTPTLEETERETIRRALERNGGRRKATAKELNISERTLYRKLKDFGIE